MPTAPAPATGCRSSRSSRRPGRCSEGDGCGNGGAPRGRRRPRGGAIYDVPTALIAVVSLGALWRYTRRDGALHTSTGPDVRQRLTEGQGSENVGCAPSG